MFCKNTTSWLNAQISDLYLGRFRGLRGHIGVPVASQLPAGGGFGSLSVGYPAFGGSGTQTPGRAGPITDKKEVLRDWKKHFERNRAPEISIRKIKCDSASLEKAKYR